jgi:hypothetical protein
LPGELIFIMPVHPLQREGLAILTGDSPILDVAREVSAIIARTGIDAAIIGGVAVVLHGHVRTTVDVDVYTSEPDALKSALEAGEFRFDPTLRQFEKEGVPVHLVTPSLVPDPPRKHEQIGGIHTVSLADLINIKLRSGSENILRAQDMADVIGLIRCRNLRGDFTSKLSKDLRPAFRTLLNAIRKGS